MKLSRQQLWAFNDCELEETQNFISLINSSRVNQRERDKIFWTVDKKGEYLVKACYRLLEGGIACSLLEGIIWNNCIPPKVSVFACRCGGARC